jgi:hypothetical protein
VPAGSERGNATQTLEGISAVHICTTIEKGRIDRVITQTRDHCHPRANNAHNLMGQLVDGVWQPGCPTQAKGHLRARDHDVSRLRHMR